jgi:hypothetical protein
MSIFKFMNSKVLFKDVRHRPYLSTGLPVMVHISESPECLCTIAAVALRCWYGRRWCAVQWLAPPPSPPPPTTTTTTTTATGTQHAPH